MFSITHIRTVSSQPEALHNISVSISSWLWDNPKLSNWTECRIQILVTNGNSSSALDFLGSLSSHRISSLIVVNASRLFCRAEAFAICQIEFVLRTIAFPFESPVEMLTSRCVVDSINGTVHQDISMPPPRFPCPDVPEPGPKFDPTDLPKVHIDEKTYRISSNLVNYGNGWGEMDASLQCDRSLVKTRTCVLAPGGNCSVWWDLPARPPLVCNITFRNLPNPCAIGQVFR